MLYELGASCWIFWSTASLAFLVVNCGAKGGPNRKKPRKVGNSAESIFKDVSSQKKSVKLGPPNATVAALSLAQKQQNEPVAAVNKESEGKQASKQQPLNQKSSDQQQELEQKETPKKEKSENAPEESPKESKDKGNTQVTQSNKSKKTEGSAKKNKSEKAKFDQTQLTKEDSVRNTQVDSTSARAVTDRTVSSNSFKE